jgi:hypothetical protein
LAAGLPDPKNSQVAHLNGCDESCGETQLSPCGKAAFLPVNREPLKTQKIEANERSKSKSKRGMQLVKAAEKVNEHF